MNTKSMLQLLAPFAVTIAWYIVWCIFVAISTFGSYDIFAFDGSGQTVFWIINIILIIVAEVFITNELD